MAEIDTLPAIPADLQEAGYRILYGDEETMTDESLVGMYWWVWIKPRSGLAFCSEGEWETAEEAIANARLDMERHP